MWDGPYGDWGSRKYLIASLDQSLRRMELEYVDIFYHHRPDPETPLKETMRALDHIVRPRVKRCTSGCLTTRLHWRVKLSTSLTTRARRA